MNHLKTKIKRTTKKRPTSKNSYPSHKSTMSTKTKDFIQKICYKKTASVDMTKHGFINDNKMYAVNLLLRPLREKLEKICGNKHMEDIKEPPIKPSPKRKYASWRKISRTRLRADRTKNKEKSKKVAT